MAESRQGKTRAVLIVALQLLIASMLVGCATVAPLQLQTPPWQDGEISTYDLYSRQGDAVGRATWRWERLPEGWEQHWTVALATRDDVGVVTIDEDLYPIHSILDRTVAVHEAHYREDAITLVTTPADDEPATKTLARPAHPIDNGQSLQTQRALPFAEGYVTRYTNVIPTTGNVGQTQVRVIGVEEVSTPAGTFAGWHVTMTTGPATHDAWYSVEPPHLMLRYLNRQAGSQFLLRAWREHADAPWQGASDDLAFAVDQPPRGPNWLSVMIAFAVQYPLMILFPLALGWGIRHRYGVGWRVYAIGAVTFVASQVVHLPANYALGLLGPTRGVALWPLPLVALTAGLTSGIAEEVARWLVLRFWLRDVRDWAGALQFGAGHGGVEAIIFGTLALLGMLSTLAATAVGQVGPEVAAYWQTPSSHFALAGLERVFAITTHIALAMLVMRSVAQRRPVYLLAAIAVHALMNTWTVWASQTLGLAWTEVGLAVIALAALGLIVGWRRLGTLDDTTDSIEGATR